MHYLALASDYDGTLAHDSHVSAETLTAITRLKESLDAKIFEPMPVRRVYIPKANSEKKRPLDIPTLRDRIVQEALRMILEPLDLYVCSPYGWLNLIFKPILPLLEPTRHDRVIRKFANANELW